MTQTLQELKKSSADLPASERAALAHFLLRTLEPEDDGWAEAWQEELTRRFEEIRSGKVIGIPAEKVLTKLREQYP